jgi:hypothetical protein
LCSKKFNFMFASLCSGNSRYMAALNHRADGKRIGVVGLKIAIHLGVVRKRLLL